MRSAWRCIFGITLLSSVPLAKAQTWYDTDWGYRKKITVDNTKVSTVGSTNLSSFPILINRTDTDWKDTANGGKVAQGDGGDILFTSSNGSTKLDHEIESYDESTGALVAWVEIPTLTATTDTDIYIYYGNSSGTLSESNATGTWDGNFAGVWHLASNADDVLQFDTAGIAPTMVHIGNDIFVVSYRGPGDDGWVKTLRIQDDGSIAAVIDSLEFDAVNGRGPSIAHMTNDIYAVAYKGPDNDGFIVTIDVDSSGNIGSVQDTLEYYTADVGNSVVVKVASGMCAVAYKEVSSGDGWMATIDIAGNGTIGSVQDTLEFDTADAQFMSLRHVTGDIYAVAYQGVNDDGFLKTVDIASDGTIGSVQDTLEFDTGHTNNSSIEHVSGDIYAIAYEGPSTAGWIKTVDIASNGQIGSVQDSLQFDATQGKTPGLRQVASGMFAMSYRGPSDDGFLVTLPIAANGTISSIVQTVEFDTASGRQAFLLPGTGSRYAIAYKGDSDEGLFRSTQIASNGTIGGIGDSTSNANSGYTVSMDASSAVAAQIGRGYVLDGSSDYGQVPHDATLSLTSTWTLSAWVNSDALSAYDLVFNKGTSGTNQNYWLATNADEVSQGFHNGSFREFNTASENLSTTTWYHIAATYDDAADQVYVYLDGAEVLDSTTTQSPVSNTEALYIGRSQYGEYWDGKLDELRVSSTVRSADWIQTCHTNQNAPGSFYTVSSEDTPSPNTPDAPSSLGGATYVDGSAATDKTPTLSFTQSDTDSGETLAFQVQIDDSSDFGSVVVDYTSASLTQGATSFTVGQAAGSGSYAAGSASQQLSRSKYYWRVRSNDGTSNGPWSTANGGAVAFYVGLPTAGVCP